MDRERGLSTAGERVAELAQERGLTVASAESCTGGLIASRLAEGSSASEWFAGGIVSYMSQVKHDLLGVPAGPVVSEPAAIAMAKGVAKLLDADATVSVTCAAGPEPQDGQPPGTVFIATSIVGEASCDLLCVEGEPRDVIEHATEQAIDRLVAAISGSGEPR